MKPWVCPWRRRVHSSSLPSQLQGVAASPPPSTPPSPRPGGGRRTPHPEGRELGPHLPDPPQAHPPETWSLSPGAGWGRLEGKVSYLPVLLPPGCVAMSGQGGTRTRH